MADTLTTLEKATIVKADDLALPGGSFSVTSSDPTIASVGVLGGFWYAFGQSTGTAILTATRNADGATAILTATVTAGDGFTVHLGEHSAK